MSSLSLSAGPHLMPLLREDLSGNQAASSQLKPPSGVSVRQRDRVNPIALARLASL
jgi:hypothetical protein